MTDTDDQDDELLVGDLVNDPVVADAQPVPVGVTGQLLDVGVLPPRIFSERNVPSLVYIRSPVAAAARSPANRTASWSRR